MKITKKEKEAINKDLVMVHYNVDSFVSQPRYKVEQALEATNINELVAGSNQTIAEEALMALAGVHSTVIVAEDAAEGIRLSAISARGEIYLAFRDVVEKQSGKKPSQEKIGEAFGVKINTISKYINAHYFLKANLNSPQGEKSLNEMTVSEMASKGAKLQKELGTNKPKTKKQINKDYQDSLKAKKEQEDAEAKAAEEAKAAKAKQEEEIVVPELSKLIGDEELYIKEIQKTCNMVEAQYTQRLKRKTVKDTEALLEHIVVTPELLDIFKRLIKLNKGIK